MNALARAWLEAEAAEDRYHASVAAWGSAERAIARPLEAARISAHRAWVTAGNPIEDAAQARENDARNTEPS